MLTALLLYDEPADTACHTVMDVVPSTMLSDLP